MFLFAVTHDLKIVSAYKLLKCHTLFQHGVEHSYSDLYGTLFREFKYTKLESRCLFFPYIFPSFFTIEGRLKWILLGSQGPHKRDRTKT